MGALAQSDQDWLGYVAFCPQTSACRNRAASRGLLDAMGCWTGRGAGRAGGAAGAGDTITPAAAFWRSERRRDRTGETAASCWSRALEGSMTARRRGRSWKLEEPAHKETGAAKASRVRRAPAGGSNSGSATDGSRDGSRDGRRRAPELTWVAHSPRAGSCTRPWACL